MVIKYHEAAFAHQITEADIEWAHETSFHVRFNVRPFGRII